MPTGAESSAAVTLAVMIPGGSAKSFRTSRSRRPSTGVSTGEITGPHFLERDYLVRVISRCNCWIVEAGLADKFNPDERLFRVQLTLVGLGSFGQGPLNRNYLGLLPGTQLGQRPGVGPGRSGFY